LHYFVGADHRNLRTGSRIKPWKVKNGGKVPKVGAPQNNTYMVRILCHGKLGQENSIYDLKRAAHTWDTFLPLDFWFLDFYAADAVCTKKSIKFLPQ
jgi:hypothetical protein